MPWIHATVNGDTARCLDQGGTPSTHLSMAGVILGPCARAATSPSYGMRCASGSHQRLCRQGTAACVRPCCLVGSARPRSRQYANILWSPGSRAPGSSRLGVGTDTTVVCCSLETIADTLIPSTRSLFVSLCMCLVSSSAGVVCCSTIYRASRQASRWTRIGRCTLYLLCCPGVPCGEV